MSEVRRVDPTSDGRWDSFVQSHPRATIYHLGAWSEILSRAYRFRPEHLGLEDGAGNLRGVLPLLSRRGVVTGLRMRSLPAIEIGGPLGADAAIERELIAAACDEAQRRNSELTIDSTQPLAPSDNLLQEVPRPPCWIAPVPAGEAYDKWLEARSSNVRRGVKRARSRGVVVRLTESEGDLRRFYRLYLETMRKHRSLPRSWRQLALARALLPRGTFRLFIAEHDGRVVAGGVFHDFGGSLELLYNASDPGALDLRPNHALYAEVMRWASHASTASFDHGFAWPESDLARFKQQWGGVATPRFRYTTSPGRGNHPTDEDSAPPRARKAIERAWGGMPLTATRVGAALAYRYL